MAAAHATGVAALLLEANPKLSPNLLKTILLVTAIKLTSPHAFEQGAGLVNAANGLSACSKPGYQEAQAEK